MEVFWNLRMAATVLLFLPKTLMVAAVSIRKVVVREKCWRLQGSWHPVLLRRKGDFYPTGLLNFQA